MSNKPTKPSPADRLRIQIIRSEQRIKAAQRVIDGEKAKVTDLNKKLPAKPGEKPKK